MTDQTVSLIDKLNSVLPSGGGGAGQQHYMQGCVDTLAKIKKIIMEDAKAVKSSRDAGKPETAPEAAGLESGCAQPSSTNTSHMDIKRQPMEVQKVVSDTLNEETYPVWMIEQWCGGSIDSLEDGKTYNVTGTHLRQILQS